MGSKYVIELEPDRLSGGSALYRAKGFEALVFSEEGLALLTPLSDEVEREVEKASRMARQDGRNEAWSKMVDISRMPPETLKKIFGGTRLRDVFDYTYDTVCSLMDAFGMEQRRAKDGRIRVGDIVRPVINPDIEVWVIDVSSDTFSGIAIRTVPGYTRKGGWYGNRPLCHYEKTGKSYSLYDVLDAVKEAR